MSIQFFVSISGSKMSYLRYHLYILNIETLLLADYVNFVDSTKKQITYFQIIIDFLLLFYLCFHFISYLHTWIINNFSLEQISRTSNLDSSLIQRQYKLDLLPRFMKIKSINPKLRQDEMAEKLSCSSSTLKRYRNKINMLSSYRIPPNSNRRRQKFSSDLNWPQIIR